MPLKRELGLFDATSIGVGAIIGGGIFVVTGAAAGLAGPALVLSLLISALIAAFSALSFAQLAERIPKEGGGYEYAHELLSPFAGFLSGWLWLISNTVVGAVVALGFAHYLAPFVPLPANLIAAAACVLVTVVNYAGVKESGRLNDALVLAKLAVLFLFVGAGMLAVRQANFTPLAPNGSMGVMQGAALIFFAYGGFARITTVGGEVRDPRRTIPRAIVLALIISTAVYLLVGFTAVGLVGSGALSGTGAPLAVAARAEPPGLVELVSLGALAATLSVLLTTVLGLSRVSFVMGQNGELPSSLSVLHARRAVPHRAIILFGALMTAAALFTDISEAAALSNFGMLTYYAMANLAALRLVRPRYPRAISVIGLVSCLLLLPFLSPRALALGGVVLLAGAAYYLARVRQKRGG